MRVAAFLTILTIGAATAATAQTNTTPQTTAPPSATSRTPGNMGAGDNGNSAVKSTRPNADQPQGGNAKSAKLEAGANSFTESQAKSRIEGAGFGNVTGLAKDDQGIWRGKAQKDGKQVTVGLDFKGNVASE